MEDRKVRSKIETTNKVGNYLLFRKVVKKAKEFGCEESVIITHFGDSDTKTLQKYFDKPELFSKFVNKKYTPTKTNTYIKKN